MTISFVLNHLLNGETQLDPATADGWYFSPFGLDILIGPFNSKADAEKARNQETRYFAFWPEDGDGPFVYEEIPADPIPEEDRIIVIVKPLPDGRRTYRVEDGSCPEERVELTTHQKLDTALKMVGAVLDLEEAVLRQERRVR